MKTSICFIVVLFFGASLSAGNDPTYIPDSLKPFRIITKAKLVHLNDSVFDLKDFGSK